MLAILVAMTGCVVKSDETPEPLPDGTIIVAWEVGASGCEAAEVRACEISMRVVMVSCSRSRSARASPPTRRCSARQRRPDPW